jgi:hypothetical protein
MMMLARRFQSTLQSPVQSTVQSTLTSPWLQQWFPSGITFAMAYGSGVFKQVGHVRNQVCSLRPLALGVDEWL